MIKNIPGKLWSVFKLALLPCDGWLMQTDVFFTVECFFLANLVQ